MGDGTAHPAREGWEKGWQDMPNANTMENGGNGGGAVAVAVHELLAGVRQGEPVRSGPLTLIPLLPADAQVKRQSGYLPLERALHDELVAITEQAQAQVPELLATSKAESPVVLVGGEQVVGGLQNRVLNTTILVAAHSELKIPVTCVEHGRWHEARESYAAPTGQSGEQPQNPAAVRAARAFSSDEAAYANLRKMHAKSVTASLSAGSGYHSDQLGVWDEVADRMHRSRAYSPSGAMYALYSAPDRSAKLKETMEALPRPADALGFIALLGSEVLGAELFSDEALADAYWQKLARSYAVEALDAGERTGEQTDTAANPGEIRLLDEALAADIEVHPSPGLGTDARLVSKGVSGAGLVYDGAVVHLSLFPEDENADTTHAQPARHYGGHRQSYPAVSQEQNQLPRTEPGSESAE
jgi:hypothetical protein